MANPAAYPWTNDTPVLRVFEELVRDQESRPAVDAMSWHLRCPSVLEDITPDQVLSMSLETLDAAPVEDVTTHLNDIQESGPGCESLQKLKMARKIFVVARDGLLLTSDLAERPESFRQLFGLCRALGRIGDSQGTNETAVTGALEAVTGLDVTEGSALSSVSRATFEQRITDRLHTDDLLNLPDFGSLDFGHFHGLRKDFRRVTGVTALAALAHPDNELQVQFARDGLTINRQYGDIKDTLESQAQATWLYA